MDRIAISANLFDSHNNIGIFCQDLGGNVEFFQHWHRLQTTADVLQTKQLGNKNNRIPTIYTKGLINKYRLFALTPALHICGKDKIGTTINRHDSQNS